MTQKNDTQRITLVTVEFDLPVLEISLDPTLMNKMVNINDEISMKYLYDSTNADILLYSATLYYNFEKVAVVLFDY